MSAARNELTAFLKTNSGPLFGEKKKELEELEAKKDLLEQMDKDYVDPGRLLATSVSDLRRPLPSLAACCCPVVVFATYGATTALFRCTLPFCAAAHLVRQLRRVEGSGE